MIAVTIVQPVRPTPVPLIVVPLLVPIEPVDPDMLPEPGDALAIPVEPVPAPVPVPVPMPVVPMPEVSEHMIMTWSPTFTRERSERADVWTGSVRLSARPPDVAEAEPGLLPDAAVDPVAPEPAIVSATVIVLAAVSTATTSTATGAAAVDPVPPAVPMPGEAYASGLELA
jgi:hypothetical protein